jgi:hypothetical protein
VLVRSAGYEGSAGDRTATMAMIGLAGGAAPVEPRKGASPNAKMPPSDAVIQ